MKTTRTIKIALCGPSDVKKEIGIAREVIQEWNQRNWEALNCGLKDVHWDTDAVPSMDARGQAVINAELIDSSDLVIAIFWQRLGTATGLHDSGSVEEVARAQAREIPVMLYFSDIEDIRADADPDQRDMLRAYRAKAMQAGLPWTFQGRSEFRKRFAGHLDKKVREILAKKPKKKAAKERPSINQKQSGSGNIQFAGDGNTLNYKSTSPRPPKIVIEPSPDHLTPSDQKQVSDWIEKLAVLKEEVEGETTARAKGELWSRLKNQFGVAKYEQIESASMPDVKAWHEAVRREIQAKARRKAPGIYRQGKIPGIKKRMKAMGRTNEDYYPEIARRLGMRRFSSLNGLSTKNLDRVYQLVLRDAKRRG